MEEIDLTIARTGGTICLVRPKTVAGKDWLDETAPEDATFWGGALVLGHPRFIEGVMVAAHESGLSIALEPGLAAC